MIMKLTQQMKIQISFLILLLTLQMSHTDLFSQISVPFNKGVNLTNWFQVNEVGQIQINKYTKKDFEQLKSLGCDVIRLPIHLHSHSSGQPNFEVNPLLFEFLDEIVAWAEDLNIHLILDNHTFDPSGFTPLNIDLPLLKIWPQIASHFNGKYKHIYFEILNEPNGITDAAWNQIQGKVVTAIRQVNKEHTIIVGPANWNNYQNLKSMPVYEDKNLIYTFHFYEPFLFTHQGASWVTPSMSPLKDIPFPYQKAKMPVFPAQLKGTWVESAFNDYGRIGHIDYVKEQLSIAVKFSKDRNVPIYCGEFGVFAAASPEIDRSFWYEYIRKELESQKIPWTMWDYHGGFGLFNDGSNGLFDFDLNIPLVKALGLNVPQQAKYEKIPLENEQWLYRERLSTSLRESSYGAGKINYYSQEKPFEGKYALSWENPKQYDIVGWEFHPEANLSKMVQQNFILSFYVKGNIIGKNIDVRFLDSKTGAGDRPWRITFRLDEKMVKWDDSWQLIEIPLSKFKEQGAWDENKWHNPEGKFDWKSIDRIEFVAESSDLSSGILFFDEIRLKPSSPSFTSQISNLLKFDLYPNPASNELRVNVSSVEHTFQYQIFDLQGIEKKSGQIENQVNIPIHDITNGNYIISITSKNGNQGSQPFIILH
jgi:endoglucanase